MKENSIIRFEDGRSYQLKTLLRKPVGFALLRSQPARLEAMDESLGTPLRFAAKRLSDGELLIVASNSTPKKALKGHQSIKIRAHGIRYKSWFRLGFDQLSKWILFQQETADQIWSRIWPKRKSTPQT